jgi:N-acetylglucosamine-6-phosphate deacetylase
MIHALINARVLLTDGLADGHGIIIENGRIAEVQPMASLAYAGLPVLDCCGLTLLPGFIDVQVNGGGGVLFNDDTSVEGIAAIAAAHRQFGTTGLLPTLISDDLDVIADAIDAVDAAIAAGTPGVLGIHIEGPYISERRKGTHNESKFRELVEADIALLSRLRTGKTLVTLAPERNDLAYIRKLAQAGIIVSAGHTDAGFRCAQNAIAAGLSGFTHLFNAMSPLGNREPGAVGAALYHQETWCGIIVDGYHVDPVTLKIALRCKPWQRFMLVTDAMPNLGTDAVDFQLQGKTVHLRDGRLIDDNGVLSGSALDMASAVRNAVQLLELPLEVAANMASRNPAEFLGLGASHGRIAPGYHADLVLVDDDILIKQTWIGGIMNQD